MDICSLWMVLILHRSARSTMLISLDQKVPQVICQPFLPSFGRVLSIFPCFPNIMEIQPHWQVQPKIKASRTWGSFPPYRCDFAKNPRRYRSFQARSLRSPQLRHRLHVGRPADRSWDLQSADQEWFLKDNELIICLWVCLVHINYTMHWLVSDIWNVGTAFVGRKELQLGRSLAMCISIDWSRETNRWAPSLSNFAECCCFAIYSELRFTSFILTLRHYWFSLSLWLSFKYVLKLF